MSANETITLRLCPDCARQFFFSSEHIMKQINPKQKPEDECHYCEVQAGIDFEITKKPHRKKHCI